MATPEELIEALRAVSDAVPDATLVRNRVGNLAVLDGEGVYRGWVDLVHASWEADV